MLVCERETPSKLDPKEKSYKNFLADISRRIPLHQLESLGLKPIQIQSVLEGDGSSSRCKRMLSFMSDSYYNAELDSDVRKKSAVVTATCDLIICYVLEGTLYQGVHHVKGN